MERLEAPPALPMPLQYMMIWEAMEGAREGGIKDVRLVPTGQIAGMIRERKSAGQIIDEMVEGAVRAMEEMSSSR